jgi:hypothetical protein
MALRTASVAERDIVESALWLDQQQAGLGSDLLTAVEETLAEIERRPLACPTLSLSGATFKSQLRWLTVGRFPYLAIFTVSGDDILVVAILHAHRDLESILRARIGGN